MTVTGSTITELNNTSATPATAGAINVGGGNTLTLAGADMITGGLFAIGTGAASAAAGNTAGLVSTPSVAELASGATNPTVTLTIQASSGTLAALSGLGVSVVNGLDGSNGTIEVRGTLSAINAALSGGLTYTYAPGTTSNTLTLSVDDGSGDTAFRTLSINTTTPSAPTFTITAVNGQINNAGLIDVTGTTTLDSDTLFNSGATVKVEASDHLTLDDTRISGGTITNLGTVEITGFGSISSGAVLTNTGAQLTIDPNATLILSSATITGGTINDGTSGSGATIEVLGGATITGGAQLNNGSVIVAAGQTLALNNVTATGSTVTINNSNANAGIVSVGSGTTLTLAGTDTITGGLFAVGSSAVSAAGSSVFFSSIGIDDLTSGDNPIVTLTIQASSGTLAALSGAGVTVVNGLDGSNGTIEVRGTLSAIKAALSGGLTYTYAPGTTSNTLTLSVDDGSGDTAFRTLSINTTTPSAPTSTITAASGEIKNGGTIDVTGATTLDSVTLLNGGGTVKVEASDHLTLDDSRIYNGTITNLGTVEVTGIGSIANGAVLTNTGAQLTIDGSSTLKLSGGTITGGTITNNGLIDVGGSSTINGGAALNGGQVTVEANQTLTLNNVTVTGDAITELTASVRYFLDRRCDQCWQRHGLDLGGDRHD